MSSVKFGFIGTGNMGGALARAVRKSVNGDELILSDINSVKAELLADELKCLHGDNYAVTLKAKYIFLGVKPQMMGKTLAEIGETLSKRSDRFVLVTMAAGLKIADINEMLGCKYPVIRIMPNMPASIGDGMILYTASEDVFTDEITEFCESMKFAGRLDNLDEGLIDAASAISGCGPAFVYMFAESMADAGVECGLPRAKAIEYAAQTLLGAAGLILATGKHPGQLKDEVCSPGGTTIAGVHSLEASAFRGTVMGAVKSAYDKTVSLGK